MIPDTFTCEMVSWEYFSTLAKTLAQRIKQSGFRPDLVIAIGRGGYVLLGVSTIYLDLDQFQVEHQNGCRRKPAVTVRFPLLIS
jgi:hypoxanthine phosphoribosyltransferase